MAFRAVILALFVFLGGCASVDANRILPTVDAMEYRIGAGDKLAIAVFREDALTGEFTVNELGILSLPLVGEIQAGGKSVPQFREELTATLGEYVRSPRVTVSVVSYRPVYVLGEVQRPGEYEYTERMSIYALVAKAGGFTYRADQSVVFVRHENETEESAYRLTSGAAVMPGDTVRFGQRYF